MVKIIQVKEIWSKENQKLCGLKSGEEIYYSLPLDINMEGMFRQNSYMVMTNRRVLVLEEGILTREFLIDEVDAIKSEPQIACGIVFLEQNGKHILINLQS